MSDRLSYVIIAFLGVVLFLFGLRWAGVYEVSNNKTINVPGWEYYHATPTPTSTPILTKEGMDKKYDEFKRRVSR